MDRVRQPITTRARGSDRTPTALVAAGLMALVVAGTWVVGPAGAGGGPAAGAAAATTPAPGAPTASVDPVGTYDPGYHGPIAYQPTPAPGVTPSPQPDPGHLVIPGITLPPQSSGGVVEVRLEKAIEPGYVPVSFHLRLTLGSDFATRLDRAIYLWGANNLRDLADEPRVAGSLLAQSGSNAYDGWVTFELPSGLSGAATIRVTIDPAASTELVLPVVIGDGVPQPTGSVGPVSILLSNT